MPRRCRTEPQLPALLRHQDYVIGRDQALDLGITVRAVSRLLRDRRWQRLLPEVYLCHPGEASRRQRLIAAQLFTGPTSAVDSDDACIFHGVKAVAADAELIRVVVPQDAAVRSRGFVVVRRQTAPITFVATPRLRYVDPATAVIAAARRRKERAALAVVSDAVQRGIVSYVELLRAHIQGPPRNARPTDAALDHVRAGIRSAPEADFRLLAEASPVLPPLRYNCVLRLPDGAVISPDALAIEAGVVHETNGEVAHRRADLFDDMQVRHDRMTAAGLVVLHNTPGRIARNGREVIRQFEQCYVRYAGRGLPPGVQLLTIAA